jgi:hypothetical protein
MIDSSSRVSNKFSSNVVQPVLLSMRGSIQGEKGIEVRGIHTRQRE